MAKSINPVSFNTANKLATYHPASLLPSVSGALSSLPAIPSLSSLSLPSMTLSSDLINGVLGTSIPSIPSSITNPDFVNPLASLVTSASDAVNSSLEAQAAALNLQMSGLNMLVGRLGGAASSGLGGLTAAAAALGSSMIPTGMGNIMTGIGNAAGGTLNGLQTLAGSTSNIAADIAGSLNLLTGGSLAGGVQSFAGQVSGAAGMLGNLLSLRRASSLPAGAELFTQTGSQITLSPGKGSDWRVRISAQWELFGENPLFAKLKATGGVVWPVLPDITVSTKANYSAIDAVHSNYPFQAYKNSQVDEIQISGEFICETATDAAYWIAATTFFKTATKMFFGGGTHAGSPPIICQLNGYGSSIFNNVPVVVKSFSVDLPSDVNYVWCNELDTSTWVPVVSTITVVVSPIYNRSKLRTFDLATYASGGLKGDGVGYI